MILATNFVVPSFFFTMLYPTTEPDTELLGMKVKFEIKDMKNCLHYVARKLMMSATKRLIIDFPV